MVIGMTETVTLMSYGMYCITDGKCAVTVLCSGMPLRILLTPGVRHTGKLVAEDFQARLLEVNRAMTIPPPATPCPKVA